MKPETTRWHRSCTDVCPLGGGGGMVGAGGRMEEDPVADLGPQPFTISIAHNLNNVHLPCRIYTSI